MLKSNFGQVANTIFFIWSQVGCGLVSHQALAWSRIVAFKYAVMFGASIPPVGVHKMECLTLVRFPFHMKEFNMPCICGDVIVKKG